MGDLSSFQFFPNFAILIWEAGWYNTHTFWPTSHNTLMFEGNVYSLPAKNASERVGREMAAVAFKEYSLQDANTLEATQLGLEARVVDRFPLNDQEILVRNFHQVVADWVDEYELEGIPGGDRDGVAAELSSPTWSRSRRRWCLATEPERWAERMAQHDAGACRRSTTPCFRESQDAIEYCDRFPLDDMPDDAVHLLRLVLLVRDRVVRGRAVGPAVRARHARHVVRPLRRAVAVGTRR